MKKIKIAFDLDRVFVAYPPFIPSTILERFYKKMGSKLSYRSPGTIETQLRIFSHNYLFRSPMKENIEALKKLYRRKNLELYIISSRFSFLKKKTQLWNEKYKISKFFKKMFFNFKDEQPHIF